MIGYIDEKDIRYEVPANPDLLTQLAFPQTRIHKGWEKPGVEGTVYPQITDITNTGEEKVADGYQDRGRSPTYGRIVRFLPFAVPWLPFLWSLHEVSRYV